MATSNYLTGFLNFLTLVLGAAIIFAGVWFSHHYNLNCVKFLQIPIISLGIFIVLVSTAGFIGSCFQISWLLWIYLLVMLLLILSLLAFTAFSFVVTSQSSNHHMDNYNPFQARSYRDYTLSDYSPWLQQSVGKSDNWEKIRACLIEARVCSELDSKYPTEASLAGAHLSPLEAGCCEPPSVCEFSFGSATWWSDPKSPGSDVDCYRWGNDKGVLCWECDACKAGVLQRVKTEWRKVALINIAIFILLFVVYSVGCCAFWNARKNEAYHRKSSSLE